MIALISGKIVYKGIAHVIVDVQGVGYRVFIPLTTFYELPEAGQPITLHVHTNVKQDAINLFGFHTIQERDLFQLMISVSGIGPRIAMNILSGISSQELGQALAHYRVVIRQNNSNGHLVYPGQIGWTGRNEVGWRRQRFDREAQRSAGTRRCT